MASIINATTSTGLVSSADNSGSLQLATNNGTTAVTIDTSQNVGIGTASPSYKLHVANGYGFFSGANYGVILGEDNCLIAGTSATLNSANMVFYTANTERMRITSGGNVLVGRTTNTVGAKMCVDGDAGLSIERDSNGYRRMTMTSSIMYFFNGSNEATLSSAGAWTNASDARLKTNIEPIKYGLNTVLETQPRSFNRVDVEGDYIGFVAQELKEKIPEVVFGEEERQYSVDYGSLVAVAFKAIQELSASVDTLNAKVEAQAVRIAELEGAR